MPECVLLRRSGKSRVRRFPKLQIGFLRGNGPYRFVRLCVKIFELDALTVRLNVGSRIPAATASSGCLLHWGSQVVPAGQQRLKEKL